MALLVHITAKKDSRIIRRAGLKPFRISDAIPYGVYALPVVPDFFITHQWVRELKRRGQRQMCAVYFRVPNAEEVLVGRYNEPHSRVTAAQATGIIMHTEDGQGYEVIILRAIAPQAIVKIRDVPHIGWRYFPSAHQRRPCGCPACQPRGEIKSQRIRKAYETSFE